MFPAAPRMNESVLWVPISIFRALTPHLKRRNLGGVFNYHHAGKDSGSRDPALKCEMHLVCCSR